MNKNRKKYYKNKDTGNYGVLEENVISNQSYYYKLRLLNAIDGMIELSDQTEHVTDKNLVQVSQAEVVKALLDF